MLQLLSCMHCMRTAKFCFGVRPSHVRSLLSEGSIPNPGLRYGVQVHCTSRRVHLLTCAAVPPVQVARQQGEFLASLFASNTVTGKMETTRLAPTQPVSSWQHLAQAFQ